MLELAVFFMHGDEQTETNKGLSSFHVDEQEHQLINTSAYLKSASNEDLGDSRSNEGHQ